MPDTVIRVGGDIRDLKAKYKEAEAESKALAGKVAKAGAGSGGEGFMGGLIGAAAGAISIGIVKSIFDEFDRVGDLAARFNVSAEAIQRLGRMAKLSGSDVESAVAALTKLRKNIEGGGDDKVAKSLKAIGVNAGELLKLEPDQQMILLAQAFQKAQTTGQGFAEMQDLMGKGFTELLPLLRSSREELEKIGQAKVVSSEDIAQIQAYGDAWDALLMDMKQGFVTGTMERILGVQAMFKSMFEGVDYSTAARDIMKPYLDAIEERKKAMAQEQEAAKDNADKIAAQQRATELGKLDVQNAEKARQVAEVSMTLKERYAAVSERIATLQKQYTDDAEKDAALTGKILSLKLTQATLGKQIADEAERDNKASQLKIEQQVKAQRNLGDELAMLKARASHHRDAVRDEEKRQRMRATYEKGIAAGLSPDQARQNANQMEKWRAKAEGDHTIHGFTQGQIKPRKSPLDEMRDRNNVALKDTFTFRGLDAYAARRASGPLIPGMGQRAVDQATAKADTAKNGTRGVEDRLDKLIRNTEALADFE